jgi:hypothetical protein
MSVDNSVAQYKNNYLKRLDITTGFNTDIYAFNSNLLDSYNIYRTEPLAFPSSVVNGMDNKLLDKLADSAIDIGNMVAEIFETSSYIYSKAMHLAKILDSIDTGRWNRSLRLLGLSKRKWKKYRPKDAASRYLEFNFAIKPLIDDISKTASLYMNPSTLVSRFNLKVVVRTKHQEEGATTVGRWPPRADVTGHLNGTLCKSIKYIINDPEEIALKALGLESPAASAWEGIPFSWLVDYVVGIGPFLDRLNATNGLSVTHGYISYKVNGGYKYNYEKYHDTEVKKGYEKTFGAAVFSAYRRQIVTTFPQPSVEFTLKDISLKRASYVAALGVILKSK